MIAEYIKGLLPKEWPTVIGDLPASATEIIGVIEYDGATSTEFFGMQVNSSIFKPIVKIVFRSRTYQKGRSWADETKQLLHRYHDEKILSSLAVGSPSYLGRTQEKLHEFQVTFRFEVKE